MSATRHTRFADLGLKFPFMVAPMVGISHVAFRELVRAYTPAGVAPVVFTEMLSTRRLPSQHLEEVDSLRTSLTEGKLVAQLLGNEEAFIAASLEKLHRVHPWGVDINMGCPATQTLKHNWGVQLMHNKELAAEVVRVTKKNSARPVSVKLRASLGREFDERYLIEFTDALESAGADWITIHCRTQDQKHNGLANWEVLARLRAYRSVPLVLNGDVHTWQDALLAQASTGADGVMFARAAVTRPWILWQVAHAQGVRGTFCGRSTPPLSPDEEGAEYFRAALRFACLLEQYFGDTPIALKKAFFYLSLGSRNLLYGHDFLVGAKRRSSLWELRDYINDYADKYPQPLLARSHT